jgi:hypothetical protein
MIDVVEEWLDQTGVRPSLEAIDESERILRVDVDGQQSVNLGDGLWDWTLELRSTGAVELEVDPGSAFRRGKIRIHVTEGLRTVRFVAPAGLAQVIIVGTTRDDECEIEMVGCRVLGAESIALSVLSAEAESLFARDAEIRFWDDFEVSAFFPEGSVRLGGTASVTAESTWLRDEARLSCAESQFHLGTVYWQSEPPQELSIEAGRVHAVTLDNPVSDNRIRIADGARFDVETVRGHLTMPATTFVCGGGTLGISGHGTAITFEADGDLHLDLGDGASVEGATGSVGVSLGSGASLQGDLQSPLVITSLSAAAGTGLTAIDLSALRYQDLGSLETVERLVPTLPTWLPSARKVADARIPRDPGIIMKPFALAEAAHFWTRISAIMTARSARGARPGGDHHPFYFNKPRDNLPAWSPTP